MEELFPRSHRSFLRIMNVRILILLIGHWESKELRSLKDLYKLFGQNYSQHNSKHDTGSLLMLHPMAKMEELLRMNRQLRMTEQLLLVLVLVVVFCCISLLLNACLGMSNLLLFFRIQLLGSGLDLFLCLH